MSLTAENKKEIFKKYNSKESDTGTSEGQIAMFTSRIEHLTGHLKGNKKDVATERSLVLMVGKRRRLLNYLKSTDIERYREIVKKLKLRK
ncbi:MAG: 30S ribosomal protein S15 [Flavobacteriales bacterium]|nr:30S ribosomal protein S15 [Flavobacteriales bacterium]PCH89150.1 MAG: 30S ribosomal protein S15 [Flavobacteriales bacterium]